MPRPMLTSYEKKLDRMLDQIYGRLNGMSMAEFAAKSKLSVSTVHRIDRRDTRFPRLKTILALAGAVGMDVELVAREARKEVSR